MRQLVETLNLFPFTFYSTIDAIFGWVSDETDVLICYARLTGYLGNSCHLWRIPCSLSSSDFATRQLVCYWQSMNPLGLDWGFSMAFLKISYAAWLLSEQTGTRACIQINHQADSFPPNQSFGAR